MGWRWCGLGSNLQPPTSDPPPHTDQAEAPTLHAAGQYEPCVDRWRVSGQGNQGADSHLEAPPCVLSAGVCGGGGGGGGDGGGGGGAPANVVGSQFVASRVARPRLLLLTPEMPPVRTCFRSLTRAATILGRQTASALAPALVPAPATAPALELALELGPQPDAPTENPLAGKTHPYLRKSSAAAQLKNGSVR